MLTLWRNDPQRYVVDESHYPCPDLGEGGLYVRRLGEEAFVAHGVVRADLHGVAVRGLEHLTSPVPGRARGRIWSEGL